MIKLGMFALRSRSSGVSRNDTIDYLTYMVELDTLVLNIDRHLNNFGLRYNLNKRTYEPIFCF